MPVISQSMPFVVELLLLLLTARMFGEIMERFNQPAMIGEVLAGVILGTSLLGFAVFTNEIKVISDLGVFLLVILAGFEIDIEELRKSIRGRNAWIAIMGFIIPMFSGFVIGIIFELQIMLTVFLSLCISITALPVSIRISMNLWKKDFVNLDINNAFKS
jgi:Kef-type K+ transport system membrane component KefB